VVIQYSKLGDSFIDESFKVEREHKEFMRASIQASGLRAGSKKRVGILVGEIFPLG
jgi:hypothetical protein